MVITNKYNQDGTTLIEILVTLLVISIGALGIAALQLTSLKYNSGASIRTQASLLSNDLMDRMRANRDVAITGNYNVGSNGVAATDTAPATAASFAGIGDIPDPAMDCFVDVCTPAELAETDLLSWMTGVASLLPSGRARVSSSVAGSQTIFSITLQWRQVVNQQGSTTPNAELDQFTFTGAL